MRLTIHKSDFHDFEYLQARFFNWLIDGFIEIVENRTNFLIVQEREVDATGRPIQDPGYWLTHLYEGHRYNFITNRYEGETL